MVTGLIKFSDERNRRFSIKTIVDRQCEPPIVRKESVYKDGWQHVKNIYENQKELEIYFPDVNICKANLKDNGIIEFDYLDGISLEDIYLKAVFAEDERHFEDILAKHMEIIIGSNNNQCLFSDSEQFTEWYGSGECYVGKRALKFANFDAIPSNIIFVNEAPYFIDYEWVMKFTMPLDLVIYNCIDNLYIKNEIVETFYPEKKALEYMGVETDIKELKKSYMHFFDYIICDRDGRSYAKDKITCLKPKETLEDIRSEWQKCANEWKKSVATIEQKDKELAKANQEWQKCADEWKKSVAIIEQKDKELAKANQEWQKCADEWKKSVAIVEQKDVELVELRKQFQNTLTSVEELTKTLECIEIEKSAVLEEKNAYKNKYEAIANSKSWKAISKVRNIVKPTKEEKIKK